MRRRKSKKNYRHTESVSYKSAKPDNSHVTIHIGNNDNMSRQDNMQEVHNNSDKSRQDSKPERHVYDDNDDVHEVDAPPQPSRMERFVGIRNSLRSMRNMFHGAEMPQLNARFNEL